MLLALKFRNQAISEFVFLGDDNKRVRDTKPTFNNACKGANIEGLRFPDLTHTAGTRMLEGGANVLAISEILGHSSIELTKKGYLHPDTSLRDAVEKLANSGQGCSRIRSRKNREN